VGDRGGDPLAQVVAEVGARALGTSWIDDERLQNPQHELDQAVAAVVSEADAVPVDVESIDDRTT